MHSWHVQVPGSREGQAVFGQHAGSPVEGIKFVLEIQSQVIPVAGCKDFILRPVVILDFGRALAGLFDLRLTAFVLGGQVGDPAGQFQNIGPAVIWLDDQAFPGFGDMVLKTDQILQAESPAELGADFDGLVIGRIAPVQAHQRCGAILAGKQTGRRQCPQGRVGVVDSQGDGNFEFDIHTQAVQQIAQQDRAGIDIQDLPDPIAGVVIKVLVQPLQGMLVGLPHPSVIADERFRAAQVQVRTVRTARVELLHPTGADDLHGGGEGRQVAVSFLFFHVADANETPGMIPPPRRPGGQSPSARGSTGRR